MFQMLIIEAKQNNNVWNTLGSLLTVNSLFYTKPYSSDINIAETPKPSTRKEKPWMKMMANAYSPRPKRKSDGRFE